MPRGEFLDLPARSEKPRTAGLTHVLDKGLPVAEVRALVDGYAPYLDLWKLGWGTAYLDPAVGDKLAVLGRAGILACTGGTLLELAWAQGRHLDCLAWAADCGFPCVEVSNGVVGMSRSEKSALVAAAGARFTVLAEVGSKDPAAAVSVPEWTRQATADLTAGARWVVAEGREAGTVGLYGPDGSVRAELVDALADAVGVDRLIFEAPRREQQAWLIRRIGPEVSLGNVPPTEILATETLRRGLRADTLAVPARWRSAESRP